MEELEKLKPDQRRNAVHLLAISTLLFFGIGGLLLIRFVQDRDPIAVILGSEWILQFVLGSVAGLVIGGLAWMIVRTKMMRPIREKYVGMIGPMLRLRHHRIWLSICAGFGEEIFFRGAIQHWLGIPVTAVIFVAIHGYLDPRNWRISLYGVFMTGGMMVLGLFAHHYGLIAPMIAHAIIDIILLERLHKEWSRSIRDQS
jgi:membrane protease YdiL (CAAX protease family)